MLAAGLTGFVAYDLQLGLTLGATAILILADAVEILIGAPRRLRLQECASSG